MQRIADDGNTKDTDSILLSFAVTNSAAKMGISYIVGLELPLSLAWSFLARADGSWIPAIPRESLTLHLCSSINL